MGRRFLMSEVPLQVRGGLDGAAFRADGAGRRLAPRAPLARHALPCQARVAEGAPGGCCREACCHSGSLLLLKLTEVPLLL